MIRAIPAAGLLLTAWIAAAAEDSGALLVTNTDRCRSWRMELPAGRFAVTYHHSMYDQPVTEEYRLADAALVLTRLESPSAAVLEYFGVTAPGPSHARDTRLPVVVMRIAMGEPQRLSLDGRARSLRQYGEPGERLELRALAAGGRAGSACAGP